MILAVVCAVSAAPAKNACAKSCPFDYTPVCGGPESGSDKPITFGNACVLSNYNCENDKRALIFLSNQFDQFHISTSLSRFRPEIPRRVPQFQGSSSVLECMLLLHSETNERIANKLVGRVNILRKNIPGLVNCLHLRTSMGVTLWILIIMCVLRWSPEAE